MFIWSCNHCRSTNPYAAVLSPFHLGWGGGATSSPGRFSLALGVGREKINYFYLVIFLHKLPKSINQSKWRIDRPMPGPFPAPAPKPGKSALGTRLVGGEGGVLPIMACSRRLRPKGVPFSGFRYMKALDFTKIHLKYLKGLGNLSF